MTSAGMRSSCLLLAILLASVFAHAQTVTLSPASLSFGNQVVSIKSAAKNVTLKNGQTVALSISSIATSGDYAQTNNCGASLTAGASCVISVTFTPTTTGARTGTLTVTDNASNSPQTAPLTGTGVLPATLTPPSLGFGSEVVSTTSAAKNVTLKNNQAVALNVSSVTTSGDYAQTNNCGVSLPAGASCTISVNFTPTTTGSRTGTLTVTDDASNSPQTASLAGSGVVAPKITSLSPSIGPVGTVVTIAGSGFGASQGTSTVTFNGIPATPTTWSATSIKVSVPTGATTGNVIVTGAGAGTNGALFTVGSAPNISSLSTTSGQVGTPVAINGTNFGAVQGGSTVTFNGTSAPVTSWSMALINVTVPTGAMTGNVLVTVGGVASNSVGFTVLPTTPGISSIVPAANAVGAGVTIYGTNFGATQGTSTITFSGKAASTTYWSQQEIIAEVPAGATTGNVIVTVAGVASAPFAFTVSSTPAPYIDSVYTGNQGVTVGQLLSANGGNFGVVQGSSTLTLAGQTITPSNWNATSISFQVPLGATTGNLVVTVNGIVSNPIYLTVTSNPGISSISPNVGPIGTSVNINGSNFGSAQGSSQVWFNNVPATPSSWSANLVQVPVPAGASTGYVTMQVGGMNAAGATIFTVAPGTITNLSTTSGPVGLLVTVTGTNFGSSSSGTLTFGGTPATPTLWTPTSITAPVPVGANTGNVVVTTAGLASNGLNFTVTPGPGITSIYPTSGPPGTAVAIYGDGFGTTQGSSTVSLGTTQLTPTKWTSTEVDVQIPTGVSSGSLTVTVGGVASNGITFTVITAPTISSLSSSVGPVGFPTTITGFNFGPSQGSSTVKFNGTPAVASNWTNTSISVTVPVGATTGSVVVSVGGVSSNNVNFTVNSNAAVFSFSPIAGPVGTPVTISGTNFGATQGSGSVTFNNTTASIQSWNSNSIVTSVPPGATTGSLRVTVPGIGTQYAVSTWFTVDSAPVIGSLSPSSGPIGAAVTISGANFDTLQNFSTVTFNGVSAGALSWSPTSITTDVPAGTTSGNVVVTVGGVASNNSAFTVTPGPGIGSVFNSLGGQATGAVGATVYLAGAGFGTSQGSSTVTFGGIPATSTYWSDSEVGVTVPPGATTGNVLITVGGIASNPINFTVTTPAQVTSVSPTAGVSGTPITIQGTGFGATQRVNNENSNINLTGPGFNYYISTITSWSDTSIVATVPGIGSVEPISGNLAVTTVASGTAGAGAPFTLIPAGQVVSMSPASGPTGTPVTLTSIGLGASQGNSTVTLNGVPATPTSWSDHSIVVPVPATGFTGPWTVNVNGATWTSGGIPFYVTPVITGISPSSGTATVPVTISGTGFGPTANACQYGQGADTVTFTCPSCGGTVGSHVQSWTTNTIVAPVPNLAATGPLVVNACGIASSSVNFTVPTSGSASGTVTSVVGGTGIGGAAVTALQGGVAVATTTTGQNGTYSFPSLTAGTYDVQFAAAGYIGAYLSGNVVLVGAGTNVNAALAPAPIITSLSQSWGVAGTAITINGANFGGSQSLYSGAIAFNGVAATPTTWSNTSIVVPVPAGAMTGPVVVTIAGTASNGVNFSVGSGTLAGTVTSTAKGTAIAGAVVEALLSNVVVGTATTTSGGAYTIANIGPGTYGLQASASGFGTEVSAGNAVTVGSTTTVNFSLPAPATDSGTVTQSNGTTAISGATVTALQNNVLAATATTDSSGKFTMSALSAGAYVIQASAPGYDTQQQTATLAAGKTTTTNLSLPGQSTLTYSYDQLGRLVGVVDSLNGAATYSYDAVGNVTSIGRQSVSQVNVLSFSPVSGAVGSTVTINGTDFSATASQDSVSFNGTTAAVTSATSTQLVVTVPTGAITGTITVTAPTGSATSAMPFTVTASNAPTITGFSPSIGVVGTAIAVSGTNFDSTPSNNKVLLNTSQMTLAATSTATNLATTVPVNGVSSGHISVTTAGGQVVSTSDFYVVPSPYQTSVVGFTGRTQVNASPTLVALTNGQIALLLFDGTAGERITGVTTNSSWGCGGLQGEFLNPNGSVLNTNTCLGNENFGPLQLSLTGTYSLVIFPAQGNGQLNIALQSVSPDITGILYPTTTGTTLGPLTTTTPGQRYVFTLSGNSGTRISFTSWGSYPGCGLQATLSSPGGSNVTGFNGCMGTGTQTNPTFSGVLTLPQTGSYVLTATPGGSNTGSLYVTPYSVPADPVVSLPMNGQATVTTTVPGQDGHFTFSITSAQTIAMTFSAAASLNCEWWATLFDPNGKQIGQWQGCNNSTINTGSISLTTIGNYSVQIAPDSHEPWVVGAFTGTLQP